MRQKNSSKRIRLILMRIPLLSPLRAANYNTVLQSLTRRGDWN
jgi:hypothetical protein